MMFRIGDFSKLSRVPVKTLRYYDEIGLIKPVGVDRFTRYRYYSLDQLPRLYRILGLKELGFTLEQIGQLTEGDLSPAQLRRMLEKRRADLEHQIEQEHLLLARIESRIQEIEQEGRLPEYEILIKPVAPLWVAALDGSISSYEDAQPVFQEMFVRLERYLEQCAVRKPGNAMAIYHDAQGSVENISIEVAFQLPERYPPLGDVKVHSLPAIAAAACLVHQGPFETIGKAYQALMSWIQVHHYRLAGSTREVYLRYMPDGKENVTEILFPVTKIQERLKMEPKIVDLQGFKATGLPYIGKNENNEIPQMWDEFNRRAGEIQHYSTDLGQVAVGLCFSHPAGMEYIAAFPVDELSDIPAGMVGKQVQPQKYAVFEVHGLEDIGLTYRQINEWLVDSGYQAGEGPDFELYGEEFNPETGQGQFYIYFPVVKSE